MMALLKKTNKERNRLKPRRIRANISSAPQVGTDLLRRLADKNILISFTLLAGFVILATAILSSSYSGQTVTVAKDSLTLWSKGTYSRIALTAIVVILISAAVAFYIHRYQKRIIGNHIRAAALAGIFILLLAITKFATLLFNQTHLATATAVTAAIILSIAYDQRFALGMSLFYAAFACFAVSATGAVHVSDLRLFLTMAAAIFTCCFSLREIRTRMKLLEVTAGTAVVVFVTSATLGLLIETRFSSKIFADAGYHAVAVFLVGLLIQSLLPIIEKIFRIATSMTLLDHSDANQPLLKQLAIEAPGTFSHSLFIGSIAEAAAEAIGRNGLLCRVGSYYHDIGKINKPTYFIENEMGSRSRHKELSPEMSQLVIVGHVKDGIEMAKKYRLPAVLRQFIETHHGTTLVEYFFNEAKKKSCEKKTEPSENEFRYSGPKPRTKEAAIVMLADTVESAARSLKEVTPAKIETLVHNMAMKRLRDGQFDECELTLRELSRIENAMSKALAAHYHSRISYPEKPDEPGEKQLEKKQNQNLD